MNIANRDRLVWCAPLGKVLRPFSFCGVETTPYPLAAMALQHV